MHVVLDTNILSSALMIEAGNPAAIYRAWQEGRFTLVTCAEHLDELRAMLRKPPSRSVSNPTRRVAL